MSVVLSVVMSVHNKGHYIESLLAQLRQSTKLDELILVDDGSTDGTGEILKKYADTFIRTEDVWEVKANNAGLRVAHGDYVCIIQDDDHVIGKNWLTKMTHFMDTNNISILSGRGTGHAYCSIPNGTAADGLFEKIESCNGDFLDAKINEFRKNDKYVVYRCDFFAKKTTGIAPVFACDVTIRSPLILSREVLDSVHCFDEDFAPLMFDDHDLCLRASLKGFKVAFCRVPMVCRYQGGSSGLYTSANQAGPVIEKAAAKNATRLFEKYAGAVLGREPRCDFIGLMKL